MSESLAEALDIPFSERTPDYDRYDVLGELGRGGMGRVYRAHDNKLNRDVAIKVMMLEEASSDADREDLRTRFHREAKIVAMLHHPNIVQILDYSGAAAPVPFIVTELLHGVDLRALIKAGPMPERVVAAIGYYLAQALAHAHDAQIVHRDLKPDNIFIETGGRVVLIDFGVAKGLRVSSTRLTLMRSQTLVVGTARFSSPEQVTSTNPPGPASDLFSLGSVLYFALSQVMPFSGANRQELLANLVHTDPLDLRRLVACSDTIWLLLQQMLQKAPQARPHDGRVVADVLKRLAVDSRFATLQESIAEFLATVTTVPAAPEPPHPPAALFNAAAADAAPANVTEIVTLTAVREETQVSTITAVRGERTSIATRISRNRMARNRLLLVAPLIVVLLGLGWLVLHPRAKPLVSAPVTETQVSKGAAFLRILVKPWGKVSIDGVERGQTPVLRVVELPLGRHLVVVTNPFFGRRELVVVLPEAGREEVVSFDFTIPQ